MSDALFVSFAATPAMPVFIKSVIYLHLLLMIISLAISKSLK